jgi:hypothetical protein
MSEKIVREGQKVRYHPVIGGPDDGAIYEVELVGSVGDGRAVAWLKGKRGCVALSSLTSVTVTVAEDASVTDE